MFLKCLFFHSFVSSTSNISWGLQLHENELFSYRKMSPGRGESNEQVLMNRILFENFTKVEDSARITFSDDVKIAGKHGFFKF